ncbi:LysE family translocator [Rhodovibrionaceae bacterium A322]
MVSALLIIKAILTGFIVALPVGAVGAICMRRAFEGRWIVGVITGLAAAAADTFLAAGAVFGLSLITDLLLNNQFWLRLFGGIFLLGFGWHMIRQAHRVGDKAEELVSAEAVSQTSPGQVLSAIVTGFGLTIINPATFLAFAGIFASVGIFVDHDIDRISGLTLLLGVFIGSGLWWMTLVAGSLAMRRRASDHLLLWINRGLGGLVMVGGGVSLAYAAGIVS